MTERTMAPKGQQTRSARIEEFVTWVKTHLSGDEKGEAQIYLDRLFHAFGWAGLREAGANCELRPKKDTGGTSFADLVWKPIVLIEMKKRGEDLSKHYRQAFDYWARIVPGRPRYAVLCNFDEFQIFDFETQMDAPVDTIKLEGLAEHYGPLAFLFPTGEKPVFRNHQETVTRQAADNLAACFNSLVHRDIPRPLAQKFILQSLMALFAEDIGLLDKYFFTRLLEDCSTGRDTFDLIGGLFMAMNTPGGVHGGRFKGVAYFNGGLFSDPARIELTAGELDLLRAAAVSNWSKVRPEIFGTIFEHSLEKEDRHAYGAHFTSPVDIMKIVGPTIVEPWRQAIEAADTLKSLQELLNRIETFTVLDPACGSGNFLYIAYRELKRLEAQIYTRMGDEYKSVNPAQRPFGFVTTRNFFGMDISPFAVDIAKVTMMLAHKLAIDELSISEPALPLDNLDNNFLIRDALIQIDGSRTKWPKTDVVIGNPPFLGSKRLKPERGVDYVNAVRKAYREVPGMADYCVYWFRRTNDHLKECTVKDPFSGRAGLVGTQNIRNNASRVGGLDEIVKSSTIVEAVENQPWSGEANVHVSIANWVKSHDPKLFPKKRRLWLLSDEPNKRREAGGYDLIYKEVSLISSSLSDRTDVSAAITLECNTKPQRVFQGITPGHEGFVLTTLERDDLIAKDPHSRDVIFPYMIGRELTSGDGLPQRYIIDFGNKSIVEARKYHAAFKRIQETVLPDVKRKADEEHESENSRATHLEKWWMHWRHRADMKQAIGRLQGRYITGSRTQRWPFLFSFVSSDILPGDKLQVFAFDDDYSFGILQSLPHALWYQAKAARLKNEEDYNYSVESVFDTFPFPQRPKTSQINAVAQCGREIRDIREKAIGSDGLRGLYKTLALPGKNPLKSAHSALDEAVMAAYGFLARQDLLEQLLSLNKRLAFPLVSNQAPTAPGIPSTYPNAGKLRTKDCVGKESTKPVSQFGSLRSKIAVTHS
jgi:hypothetical protein